MHAISLLLGSDRVGSQTWRLHACWERVKFATFFAIYLRGLSIATPGKNKLEGVDGNGTRGWALLISLVTEEEHGERTKHLMVQLWSSIQGFSSCILSQLIRYGQILQEIF
jgi:hypothetical protein